MGFGNFSEDKKIKLVENIYKFTKEFKKVFNLDCFLTYGTLLGAIRDKDFIAHDGDIDIHYVSKHNDLYKVIEESMEIWDYYASQKRAIFKCCDGKGLQMHLAFKPGNYLETKKYWTHNDSYVKNCYCEENKTEKKPSYCHVDLFGSWVDKNQSHFFSIWDYRIWQSEIKNLIFPLKPFNFKGFDFYIPNNSEKFLNLYYGDWRIKDKKFKEDRNWKHWPPGEIEYGKSKGVLWELWLKNKKCYRGQRVSKAKQYIRLNKDETVDWEHEGRIKILNDILGHGKIVFWKKQNDSIYFFDENKNQTHCLIEINKNHYESEDAILQRDYLNA